MHWVFLTLAAFGQEEVCEPLSAGQLGNLLEQADQQFAELTTHRARQVLDVTTKRLPCLTSPIEPSAFARYAKQLAFLGFLDQDEIEVTRWLSAANYADATAAFPEGLVEGHPLVAHAEGTDVPELGGPTDQFLWPPPHGVVLLDGRAITLPLAPIETPGLVQVFDVKGRLVEGFWVDGAAFPERWLSSQSQQPEEEQRLRVTAQVAGGFAGWGQAIDTANSVVPDVNALSGGVGLSSTGALPVAGAVHAAWDVDVSLQVGQGVGADMYVGPALLFGPFLAMGGGGLTTVPRSVAGEVGSVVLPQPHLGLEVELPTGPVISRVGVDGGATTGAQHFGTKYQVIGELAGSVRWTAGPDLSYSRAAFVNDVEQVLTSHRLRIVLAVGIAL
jgi:hypothetical protein